MTSIIELYWQNVSPIWNTYLWPKKRGGIKQTNNWTYEIGWEKLGKDDSILKNRVRFFGFIKDDKIIATNSIFRSGEEYTRSRGLWVHEDYRGRGLAGRLLRYSAMKKETPYIWSVPRRGALYAYVAAGFEPVSGWFDDGQYGPNCIVINKR